MRNSRVVAVPLIVTGSVLAIMGALAFGAGDSWSGYVFPLLLLGFTCVTIAATAQSAELRRYKNERRDTAFSDSGRLGSAPQ